MINQTIVKLRETPSQTKLNHATGISAILTILIYTMMQPVETTLKGVSPYGVLELEFAWTAGKISTIFDTWGSALISQELFVTFIDYGFLIAYSSLFACITLQISRKLLSGRIQLIGFCLTIIPFIAAFFDAIENIHLILMLSSPSSFSSFSPFFASLFALSKFSLFIVVIMFWVLSGGWFVISQRNN